TLCCINCIHTLPDLAKLEKKYANEVVVIGVHSPKFDEEKDTEAIRKAVLRYEVSHPVITDANQAIWNTYDASSWPTLVLIDPAGKKIAVAGDGQAGTDDGGFGKARFNDPQGLALDGDTLYVADRKNNLIRALDLKAKTVATVAGTGEQGDDRESEGPALKAG